MYHRHFLPNLKGTYKYGSKERKKVTFDKLFWKEHIFSGEKNINYQYLTQLMSLQERIVLRQIFLKNPKKVRTGLSSHCI